MPRIGLIGCGRWGRFILRDLRALGAEVHVVCRSDATEANARKGGAASIANDIADLAGVDGVVVATPTATHAAVIGQVLALGVPIFVEKPMTADVDSARRLAAEAGPRLFVMDKWRYHPGIEEMRRLIAAGEVGDVLGIATTRWQWGNPHRDVTALWILAPHDLSIGLHLVGRIPAVERADALVPGRPDLAFTAILRDGSGPPLTLDVSIASPEHRRRCLVVGSRMTLELRDGYDDRVFARRGEPGDPAAREETFAVGDAMPLQAEIARFLAHVAGGPPPMSSAQEGVLIVERLASIERLLRDRAERSR